MVKKRRKWITLALFLSALGVCFLYYYRLDTKEMASILSHLQGDAISFSADSGFYDHSLKLTLKTNYDIPSDARIYYTLNGDTPTEESQLYTKEIFLALQEDSPSVYPLKAVVYYKGEPGPQFEKTYVLASSKSQLYGMELVSLTSDSKNLYDYDIGILTYGRTYDENVAAGVTGYVPCNWSNRGEDWIRDGSVVIFSPTGSVLVEQKMGLAVSGGTSTALDVKSLKLYAGTEYDASADKFELNFINQDLQYSPSSMVSRYNSIRLRSGAYDQPFGNIRSSVISRLCADSSFDGCAGSNRCLVYLNGDFYGIFDMQQNYSPSYLARRYDLADNNAIEKYKGNENSVLKYSNLSDYLHADLTIQENRDSLEALVDMDNLLLYYAIEILSNNTDWPQNNYQIWRYTGGYDPSNPYTDGRYRFLLYDVDTIWVTASFHELYEGYNADTFISLMKNIYRAKGSCFSNVMQADAYRNKFVTIVCDLMNTSFDPKAVSDVIEEENQKIAEARRHFLDEEIVELCEKCVTEMFEAVEKRPEKMKKNLLLYFGLSDTYHMTLHTSPGIQTVWNNMNIQEDSTYENDYYTGVDFTIEAQAYPGYTFQYWLVNGTAVYEPQLTLSTDLIQNGGLYIEAVAQKTEEACVIISELSASGISDWVKLTNTGSKAASLQNYYLTDNGEKPGKYQLPNVTLEPGSSIIINGSKNLNSIGDYICNFSLNETETLYLSNKTDILDSAAIPRMSEYESYGRLQSSNTWGFFDNEHGQRKSTTSAGTVYSKN